MWKRRIYGPTAFLVTLGIVVVFLGLLILLAVPAANKMDKKALEQGYEPKEKSRVTGVKQSATVSLSIGGGLMLLGFALGRRKTLKDRTE